MAAVTPVNPQRRSIRRLVEQPGTIEPYEQTQLFARVPGYVRKVHVDIDQRVSGPRHDSEGKEVEPGEALAEIAVPEMREQLKQKEAAVRQAEAEVEQARKMLAAAGADVTVALALVEEAKAGVGRAQALHTRWESESRRIAKMARSGILDDQARDETANQFEAAKATLAEARARVVSADAGVEKARADQDKAAADVRAAEARVEVAQAEVGGLEAMLNYATIRAPYDGVVTRRGIHTGDFVQPDGGKAMSLFTVARLHPVRVVIAVPEADAGLVKEKARVTLNVGSLGERTGTVARTSWALEPGARTLRTEIDLPNEDHKLRPGMYVYARLEAKNPEAWTLPVSAVVKQGEAMVCFRIEEGRAVRTPVQIGRNDGEHVEVLRYEKAGKAPSWQEWTGKEVVASAAAGLADGQEVEVKGSQAPDAP